MMTPKEFQKAFAKDMKTAVSRAMLAMGQKAYDEATGMFGHYDNGGNWPTLSKRTIENHERKFAVALSGAGFGGFDTPLVASGELMKSLEWDATATTAEVGTDDPKMKYHELGEGVPARPVFGPVVYKMEEHVQKIFATAFDENLGVR